MYDVWYSSCNIQSSLFTWWQKLDGVQTFESDPPSEPALIDLLGFFPH